jgi:hypothetical protein
MSKIKPHKHGNIVTLPCAGVGFVSHEHGFKYVLCMVGLGLLENGKAVPNLSVLNYKFLMFLLDLMYIYHSGVVACLCSILAHKSLTVAVFAAFRIQAEGTVSA